MANQLDELTGPINEDGKDINVINKQLKVEVGKGSKAFEIILWCLLIIPGLIFMFKKINQKAYFDKLEQRMQGAASEIDNAQMQRVSILENVAGLLEKSINLDKDTFTEIARLRSGASEQNDSTRNNIEEQISNVSKQISVAFERYPELKSQNTIADAMRQNNYLQREITAARSNYNDIVARWNGDIMAWPTNKIVAAKYGFTTRIPFIASSEIKMKAEGKFF